MKIKAESKDIHRGPIAWMANHSVAANLIMAFCLIGGLLVLRTIRQEVFPSTQADIVRILLPYPGANPEEIEQGIVLAVEESIRGIDGVREISSRVSENVGIISVELQEGEDLQKAARDIESEIDRITTFPEEAEDAVITTVSHRMEVISLVLYGQTDEAVLHELAEQMRDQLLQDPDITQIELAGVRPLEISIEVPQENLRRYNLTLDEIAQRLREASVDLPGGGIKTQGGEILIRMKERRDYGSQFARTAVISSSDGTAVFLEDIATVKDSYEEVDRFAVFNNKPAVMLEIYRIGRQTPLQVAAAVKEQLNILKPSLPEGISIQILRDRSEIYRQRVSLLLRNGSLGIVLVLLILGLFLELRLAFWVMLGIPISFLGSLLLVPVMDITINMVTLFAYIIAIGIVVDDAIVVGENVYYYYQQGDSFPDAAIKGAREMAVPVTFSILTNIVTFMPLYFIPGMMGKIFKMIPVVVSVVFLISLAESLFILPAHLGRQRERQLRGVRAWLNNHQQAFSRSFSNMVRNRFGPFLDFLLTRRYLVVAFSLSILILALSYAASGRMGFGLFPKIESDFARGTATLPYGSPVTKTAGAMNRMYEGARKVIEESGREELVKGIFAETGRGGSHNTYMTVYLAEPEIRDKIMSTGEFTSRWRRAVGSISGVKNLSFASDFGGPGHGAGLTVELSHRDISILERASKELADALSTYPLARDIDDGFQLGKQQLDFAVKPEGKSLGLTAQSVARQVRNAFYGSQVLRQQRGRNEIRVMVRLPKEERISEYNLDELMLFSPSGAQIPLREAVEVKRSRAYTEINRRDGRRVIQVTADVTPRSKVDELIGGLKAKELPDLVSKYPGLIYSFEGRAAERRESLRSLKVGFVLALMAIFSLLAIPFRSYIQPLIVMASIPFGIIGAVVGHIIMGYSLSLVSMFGIVALSGVVVNDALILIDLANRRIKNRGESVHDAVLEAAIQRFRPIMLTTLTTFGGLSPMMFERALAARFLIPMAISLGFGILFATVITLVLVPSLYMVSEDVRGIGSSAITGWRKISGADHT
ncbi:MAG: efflux RND transporter permease subunit [bacterium]